MVAKYGMSEKVGVLALEGMGGRPLFGKGMEEHDYSEKSGAIIDTEVGRIMSEAYKRAEKVLKEKKKALDAIADKLVEVETIERDEFEKILIANGITPKRKQEETLL